MTDGDDDGFIGLPPGMAVPVDSSSGTVRRLRQERSRADRDEIVFFPAMPGSQPVAPTPTPVPSLAVIDDVTSISDSPRALPQWRLIIEGREPVAIEGPLYLGRNPVAPADHLQARILAVDDAAKSVSKTHALLELDADGLWVHDLDSTNGVWVVPAGDDAMEVSPGQRVSVPAGAAVELGDLVIQVELS